MDKAFLSIKFWLNISLAISTSYVIILYVFTPSNNQCQMTFMMEPPKFSPIPVDLITNHNSDKNLNYPNVKIKGSSNNLEYNKSKYTLFMYSEIGFPLSSDMKRDLEDSMPVLFVPGNAGSYKQVRSLASTCTKHQLLSLEGSKFVFYTIDFKNELSAISGKLIEDQILFVDKALKQIIKLHSASSNGVILIGHSIGGFISKALITLPKFDPKNVPLLISLASPLIKPHLIFDDKMNEIYNQTNHYWAEQRFNSLKKTIAISISGGKSDRLVPMHLSMDPQFDLSITTTSINDVWLTTDHVCITWCRELMQKLCELMSALMNKKKSCLIESKEEALTIIEKKLLLGREYDNKIISGYDNMKYPVIYKDWKSMRPFVVVNYDEFYKVARRQLSESIILLNMTTLLNHQDLLIHIDHIYSLKGNGVYGCKGLNLSNPGQIHCVEKVNLLHLAKSIPTRKYEPKKTCIKLLTNENNNNNNSYEFIMLDFIGNSQIYSDNNIPESLTIQKLDFLGEQELYIPTLIEMIWKKYFLFKTFEQKIKTNGEKNIPIIYKRFKLTNLIHDSQVYSLKYESFDCKTNDGHSKGSTIILYQDNYMSESFHPAKNDKTMSVIVKLSNQKSILDKKFINNDKINNNHKKSTCHLELYIDGSCSSHKLYIELSFYDIITNTIQKNLGTILSVTTYLSMINICHAAFNLYYVVKTDISIELKQDILLNIVNNIIFISPFPILYTIIDSHQDILDKLTSVFIIYLLSKGLSSFFDYFIKRVIDIGTIIYRIQTFFIKKESVLDELNHTSKTDDEKSKVNGHVSNDEHAKIKIISNSYYLNKFIKYFVISSGIMLSTVIISIFTFSTLMKCQILIHELLNKSRLKENKQNNCCLLNNTEDKTNKHGRPANIDNHEEEFEIKRLKKKELILNSVHELIFSLTVLTSVVMICNIPSALVQLNYLTFLKSKYEESIYQLILELHLPTAIVTLIFVNIIVDKIETQYINELEDLSMKKSFIHNFFKCLNSNVLNILILIGPLIFLTDILTFNTHFCQSALLKILFWLNGFHVMLDNNQKIIVDKHQERKMSNNSSLKSKVNGVKKKHD